MLRLTIDGNPYTFDESSLMNHEAKRVQLMTGMRVKAWQEALNEGDADATTALVWLCRMRNGEPDLAFSDVTFDMGKLGMEQYDPEVEAEAAAVAGAEPAGPTPAASPPPPGG